MLHIFAARNDHVLEYCRNHIHPIANSIYAGCKAFYSTEQIKVQSCKQLTKP